MPTTKKQPPEAADLDAISASRPSGVAALQAQDRRRRFLMAYWGDLVSTERDEARRLFRQHYGIEMTPERELLETAIAAGWEVWEDSAQRRRVTRLAEAACVKVDFVTVAGIW